MKDKAMHCPYFGEPFFLVSTKPWAHLLTSVSFNEIHETGLTRGNILTEIYPERTPGSFNILLVLFRGSHWTSCSSRWLVHAPGESRSQRWEGNGSWWVDNIFKIIGDRWLALSRIFHQSVVPSWHPHFFAHMPSPFTKASPWNGRAPRCIQAPTVTWIGAYLGHPQKMSRAQGFATILAIKFAGWVIDLAYTSTCQAKNLGCFWVVDSLSSSIVDIGSLWVVSCFWISQKGGCRWSLFLPRVWVDSRARFLLSSYMWVIGLRLVLDFACCTMLYLVHCFLVICPC